MCTQTADGIPTTVTFGFVRTLLALLEQEQPDAVVIVFDAPRGATFRLVCAFGTVLSPTVSDTTKSDSLCVNVCPIRALHHVCVGAPSTNPPQTCCCAAPGESCCRHTKPTVSSPLLSSQLTWQTCSVCCTLPGYRPWQYLVTRQMT